jgi:hypothetical protein
MRHRSKVEFCIDAFVEETGYIPAAARSVRVTADLSPKLERLVAAMTATSGWRAWAEGTHGWFVQGRLSESPRNRLDYPTVYLIFRDQDALPVTAGVWCRSAPAKWDLVQFFTCRAMMSGMN